MLRFLFELFDGVTLKRLGARAALSIVALIALLIGLAFLLAAAWQAVAMMLDGLDASLIFAGLFILAAVGLFALGAYQWRRRPRPFITAARYGVAREALAVIGNLLRREPAKMVLAGLVLGAIAEFMQKREDDRDENT